MGFFAQAAITPPAPISPYRACSSRRSHGRAFKQTSEDDNTAHNTTCQQGAERQHKAGTDSMARLRAGCPRTRVTSTRLVRAASQPSPAAPAHGAAPGLLGHLQQRPGWAGENRGPSSARGAQEQQCPSSGGFIGHERVVLPLANLPSLRQREAGLVFSLLESPACRTACQQPSPSAACPAEPPCPMGLLRGRSLPLDATRAPGMLGQVNKQHLC